MRAATVVSASELPHARVLAASLQRAHPGAQLTALVLGAHGGGEEPFELLTPGELDGASAWALYGLPDEAARRYLEPFLLSRLAATEPVALLAPDVRVCGPLEELLGEAAAHGAALVPRILEPVPADGEHPTGEEVLADGLYDSGVLAVGPGASALLDWWRERAEERLGAGAAGPHPLDAAPGLFPSLRIVRDPAFGVAHWNLHERSPSGARTLRFAGFDPARPHWLSTQNTRVRAEGELAELCERHAAELREAGWRAPEEDAPGALERLGNGVPVDAALRDVIRDAVREGVPLGDLASADGAHALLEWANGPARAGAGQGVTRYLLALHARRLDLQDAFKALEDDDGAAFVRWARTDGRREGLPDALAPLPAPEARRTPEATPELGVNVAGYLGSGLGVGEAARLYVVALEAAGVPVRTETVDPHLPRPKRTSFDPRRPAVEYPVNLVCVNAFELPGFARHAGADFFEDRTTIGVWAWEASTVPASWDEAFGLVDEIWTNSEYVTGVLAQASPVPVVTIPQPVLAPSVPEGPPPLELPDAFTFLFTFDFFSTARRKNPVGLVEAYARAFAPGDGAQLVIKTFNGDVKPESLQGLLRAAEGRDDIHVIDRFLEPGAKNALLAAADCYVSLHRSEGFGLSLAEAMLLGKPVIATGYSGNLQFMTPANSWLVGYELTEVGEGVEMYPADAQWAEPDLDHAAELMREVRAGGAAVQERAQRGRRDVARDFSVEVTGSAARRRLERIAAAAGSGAPAPGSAQASAALSAAREQAARMDGGAEGVAQKAARAAVRPYHQRELDRRLLSVLDEQAARIDALEDDLRRSRHGIAAARRQSLSAEWRAEQLERRLAERDGGPE